MNTASLKLSQELKKAGYPQETSFAWVDTASDIIATGEDQFMKVVYLSGKNYRYMIAAPTAEEILGRLPDFIEKDGKNFEFRVKKHSKRFLVEYYICKHGEGNDELLEIASKFVFVSEDNLAEAAGRMWLYLKENNLL